MNFDFVNPVLWAKDAADSFFNSLSSNALIFFQELVTEFMFISTEVCIIVGLIGALLYVFGCKKYKNAPFIAYGVHLIIKILGGILIG